MAVDEKACVHAATFPKYVALISLLTYRGYRLSSTCIELAPELAT